MESFHQENEQHFDRCMAYLHNSKLRFSDEQFTHLINDFDHDPLAIKLLISYLENWHNSQLSGLASIPILQGSDQQKNHSLKRLLMAYEKQFRDCPELILLYLLSLSIKPVLQARMEQVFRLTLIKKISPYNTDYQRFLAPLSKLDKQEWDEIIENLHTLELLYLYDYHGEHLLHMEQRICQYFRKSLTVYNYNVFQYSWKDMDLVSNSNTDHLLSKKTASTTKLPNNNQQTNRSNSTDDIHSQLRALRYNLRVIQTQLQELNTMKSKFSS